MGSKAWISRVGGAGEPTFGVFPRRGFATGVDSPDRDPVGTTVEFGRHGHRLLAVEHGIGGRTGLDGPYSTVQLRTPVVPSLVVTPNVGAFEPARFTPLEDARITRNTVGSLTPDVKLRRVELDPGFDRRFTVTTSDEDFARAALTGAVRELLLGEPWFRVRAVALHEGALWTTEAGGLTEERVLGNSRQLARLTAAVPHERWGADFGSDVDTSEEAWLGRRGGLRAALNRRREARDRQPLSALSLTVRTVIAVALLLPGLLLAGNALAAITGLAPEVRLAVTESVPSTPSDGNCPTCGNTDLVSGTYDDGGTAHEVTDMWWMTWAALPEQGDVVAVSVGPLWWHPVVEGTDTAVFLLLIALLPLLTGALLAKMTYRPRPRK